MDSNRLLPSGPWTGFYLETHRARRGWMHLYLEFNDGNIRGEGTDYVGPWKIEGQYDLKTRQCRWAKQYLGQHRVDYAGQVGDQGIVGKWNIGSRLTEAFHIWPQFMGELNEKYLQEDEQLQGTIPLGRVPSDPFDNLA